MRKIAAALRMPLSQIVADSERLAEDPDIIGESESTQEEIDLDSWADRIKTEDSVPSKETVAIRHA